MTITDKSTPISPGDTIHGRSVEPEAPIMEVMRSMRAIRRLKPDPVPMGLLERLVEVATWAPTSANSQAYSFIIVTDRDQIRRLAPIYRLINGLYRGSPLAARRSQKDLAASRYLCDHYEETPALIVVCHDASRMGRFVRPWRDFLREFRQLGPRRYLEIALSARRADANSAAASVYPAVQNLLLAARALGLGATLTTAHIYLESEVKQILGIPAPVSIYAVIPVGYPIERFTPVRRRPSAEVTHFNRW